MKICSVEGCGGPHHAKGYCAKHWERVKRNGSPHTILVVQERNGYEKCQVEGCESPHHSKGYCGMHAQRMARYGNPHLAQRTFTKEYFEFCVDMTPGGCWLWRRAIVSTGYANFMGRLAHRVAYEFYKGPIPRGAIVMHSCDVRHCVNPDHLSLGTHQANSDDKIAKGRDRPPAYKRGYEHVHSKFSPAVVAEIRRMHESGLSMRAIARYFGVTHSPISAVVRGRRYNETLQKGEPHSR